MNKIFWILSFFCFNAICDTKYIIKKTIFAGELKANEKVNSVFLVNHITKMGNEENRFYLDFILSDRTGYIEARQLQDINSTVRHIEPGDFVWIEGQTEFAWDEIRIVIHKIEKIDEARVDMREYARSSVEDGDVMYGKLTDLVDELDDEHIVELLKSILADPVVAERLKKWPVVGPHYHDHRGSLLEHTLSCANLAKKLSPHYDCNTNIIVAGAILHDLCNIYRPTENINKVKQTEQGRMSEHIAAIFELLDSLIGQIGNFPRKVKSRLQHIILSQHGILPWMPPVAPQTKEACLLLHIENMDARIKYPDRTEDDLRNNGTKKRSSPQNTATEKREKYVVLRDRAEQQPTPQETSDHRESNSEASAGDGKKENQTSRKKKTLYLASGYGFSKQLKEEALPSLVAALENMGFEVWEPFRRNNQEDFSRPGWAYRIGQKDTNDVREADGIFAVVNGTPPDEGVMIELGMAIAWGKEVFLFRDDFRRCTDSEAYPLNLMLYVSLPEDRWRDYWYTSIEELAHPDKALMQWMAE